MTLHIRNIYRPYNPDLIYLNTRSVTCVLFPIFWYVYNLLWSSLQIRRSEDLCCMIMGDVRMTYRFFSFFSDHSQTCKDRRKSFYFVSTILPVVINDYCSKCGPCVNFTSWNVKCLNTIKHSKVLSHLKHSDTQYWVFAGDLLITPH